MSDDVTVDRVLGGRLSLRQPSVGYRFAIDPVLMAAAVKAHPEGKVLDIGSGVGTASFCLMSRSPGITVTGLDIQSELLALAVENASRNGFEDRISFVTGDLRDPSLFEPKSFDHIMANPPHFIGGSHTPPGDASKATAHIEEATLEDWVKAASRWVKDRGCMTMIHRADRVHEVVAAVAKRFGDINILPLWPRPGRPARRVIVQGLKASRGPARILPGLVLHDQIDKYTAEARAVLEDGQAIDLDCY
ncbi:MAG: methyltransferase [Alphaproteobacteria bacterium]|nr:methyltransferase [Alphaproteobacteria bacterium SS10]